LTLVRELMHSGLETCPGAATMGEMAAQLVRSSVHALVVVDPSGAAVGVVSDTDLLAGEWLATDETALGALKQVRADELMTAPPQAVDADEDVSAAARRLASQRIGRLLVLEHGNPVGVLAVSDMVHHLARRDLIERRCVRDVMTHGLVVCRPDTTVSNCARLMSERHTRSVVVVEADGRAVGVVSGLDLVAAAAGEAGLTTQVADLMGSPLTIEPEATLRAAADAMLQHETNRLIVAESGERDAQPLGLVSSMDVIAEMAAPRSEWRTDAGSP
jgi:CBS domain-containing protein